jgi:hypothetical protein
VFRYWWDTVHAFVVRIRFVIRRKKCGYFLRAILSQDVEPYAASAAVIFVRVCFKLVRKSSTRARFRSTSHEFWTAANAFNRIGPGLGHNEGVFPQRKVFVKENFPI